ncbi:MAG: hypothetical protein AAF560_23465 [Acidobacteriota bacterium]
MSRTARILGTACLALPLMVSWAAEPPVHEAGEIAAEEIATEAFVVTTNVAPTQDAFLRLRLPGASEDLEQLVGERYRAATPEQRRSFQQFIISTKVARSHRFCLADDDSDVCAYGAALSRQRPCLAGADDCPAYESWEHVMGAPGVMPAPEDLTSAATVVVDQSEPTPPE